MGSWSLRLYSAESATKDRKEPETQQPKGTALPAIGQGSTFERGSSETAEASYKQGTLITADFCPSGVVGVGGGRGQ
jgi:hypothetical protein